MESVKRISVLWPVGPYGYGREQVVLASEFDRVSAENLALQQRLTVQDQREDDLKDLLRRSRRYVEVAWPDGVHSYRKNSIGGDLLAELDAALKPIAEAESHVDCGSCRNITDGCKGKCQRSEEWSKP